MNNFTPSYAQLGVAVGAGYFEEENLDVKVRALGAAGLLPALITGEAHFTISGVARALSLVPEGQETVVFYNNSTGATSLYAWGSPQVASFADCKRIGTSAPGSSGYAAAVVLKRFLGGTGEFVLLNDNSATQAALVSGQLDCAVGGVGLYAALVDRGSIKKLFDPTDKSKLPPGFPADLIGGAGWGMTNVVTPKAEAIVRFLRAYDKALADVRTKTEQELVDIVRKSEDWHAFEASNLLKQFAEQRATWAPADGYISPEVWKESIAYYKDGGSDFLTDLNDPRWSHASRVNMVWYEEAIGRP